MTLEPPRESPVFSLPPFPVLRDLLGLVELFLYAAPGPVPNTWDELVVRAQQVNIEISEPWLGITYSPQTAWQRVSGRIGDRAAATASILSAAMDLLRPFDAEPQRIFTEIGDRPGSAADILSYAIGLIRPFPSEPRHNFTDTLGDSENAKEIHLDRACACFLTELRNLRHPAPPYAIDHLPSLADVHACLRLIDPDWQPLSPDAGWLEVIREARHDLSLDAGVSDKTWQLLRTLLRAHGAAVAVILSSANHATSSSRNPTTLVRQIIDRASSDQIHLDRIVADLLASSRRRSAGADQANGVNP